MKNTLRQVFHSSKFLVGFIIFLLIVLMVWLYPLFINPGNPLEMIGVGTFARPGTYVSLYDAVNTRTETLRLPDADDKRVSYLLSDADRAAMIEWFGIMDIDVSELDATDTDALLDLWFEHYDASVKPKGMTMARRNFFKRLDKSVRQIRSADTLKVMHPEEGELVERSSITKTDYVNVTDVANVKLLPLGTDNFGRDVLKELVSATGTSIVIGLIAGVVATLIGLTFGLLAGYVGGFVDDIMVMYAGQIVEKGTAKEMVFDPIHPYSHGLMGSILVPEEGTRGTTLTAIPGTPPNLKKPPQGCRFAERCRYATDECRYHAVAEKPFGEGRSYRCLLGVDKLREVYEHE